MTIEIGKIEFGEIDAKNEVLEQRKFGSSIFQNGFLVPPGISIDKLLAGAKCFIYGQKGCGKTALLLYVEHELQDRGARTKTIFFKSDITEPERQKIAGTNFQLVETNTNIKVEYDYKINWLWYIYRNILRMATEDVVLKNWDIARSLKSLLGVQGEVNTGLLNDLATKRIQGFAKAGLKAGPLSVEIAAEIEALSKNNDATEIEIIDIVEKYISSVEFRSSFRGILLFDELELFANREDQRERDLFLIRDLLYAISRVNRNVGTTNSSLGVIASVRSELLDDVNRVGPEIGRDVIDRGVKVSWNVKSDDPTQPILQIVEKKINASEHEEDQEFTDDIWPVYFPERFFGREPRQYLLDISMFKPRNIVILLSEAKSYRPNSATVSSDILEQIQAEFSKKIWTEIENGLLGMYDREMVRLIKGSLKGFKSYFLIDEFFARVDSVKINYPKSRDKVYSREQKLKIVEALYGLGAIGNNYIILEGVQKYYRNQWVFRDFYEPQFDEKFEVHESLRKELQLPFN